MARLCEFCKERESSHYVEMPLSNGNPYPEDIAYCDSSPCVAAAIWAQRWADDAEEEIERDHAPRCSECGGNAVDGYECHMSHIYKNPLQCHGITGVW